MLLEFLVHQSELSKNLEDSKKSSSKIVATKTLWRNKMVDEVEPRLFGLVLGLKSHSNLPMPWHPKSQRPKMETRAPF
jgi:hypothetical protein